mmetsp:Transcript_35951/g.101219  ORF Transcript_35951/g.101219 Transcript_35951/m.101219 type:complete len:278 (+) Transcript_35951:108-941(+)
MHNAAMRISRMSMLCAVRFCQVPATRHSAHRNSLCAKRDRPELPIMDPSDCGVGRSHWSQYTIAFGIDNQSSSAELRNDSTITLFTNNSSLAKEVLLCLCSRSMGVPGLFKTDRSGWVVRCSGSSLLLVFSGVRAAAGSSACSAAAAPNSALRPSRKASSCSGDMPDAPSSSPGPWPPACCRTLPISCWTPSALPRIAESLPRRPRLNSFALRRPRSLLLRSCDRCALPCAPWPPGPPFARAAGKRGLGVSSIAEGADGPLPPAGAIAVGALGGTRA